MSTTPAAPSPRRRGLIGVVAAAVVVAVMTVVVVVLVSHGDSADDTVPPLSPSQRQAGVIRVTNPDRRLQDQPEVTTIGGKRVSISLKGTNASGDDVEARLRIGIGEAKTTVVELAKGQRTTVRGIEFMLVAAYDSGDAANDAADLQITLP